MSYDLIPVPVWRLGRDGHIGKVVKITAPDDSWTVVGVLTWSQVRAGLTLWPDGPPSDFEGNVELTVGGWKNLHVPLDSVALVEVPRLSLDDGETLEGVVVESALRELESLDSFVSRETKCSCPDVWEPCMHCGCTDAKHHGRCPYA